ncbi:lyase family protein [Exiguobacterium sp. s189]|uniref:lyase family protein n=1 Tax=Exiguobacterium sp. s189 TaxID=2751263 RepID=UPI001BE81E8F|nr:lyase family protein [Exiguobacterium sp. s189]
MKKTSTFSGRVNQSPNKILDRLLLTPQFEFEKDKLLPYYKEIELTILDEQRRLHMLNEDEYLNLIKIIDDIDETNLFSDVEANMSDISFAFEEYIYKNSEHAIPKWHIDKSRNDFQATAMRMYGRKKLVEAINLLTSLYEVVIAKVDKYTMVVMPGYTHNQPAQIVSPAFYFVTIGEAIRTTLHRMEFLYRDINACPLGSGAMSGLEFSWDREKMSKSLGFDMPLHTALVSVAERDWLTKISFEFSLFGNKVSRFVTDFMKWSSHENGFIHLPDELVGISSAMPQKKNHTILERIRGGVNHLNSFLTDFMSSSQNTPYTNLVEVNKEGTRYLEDMFNDFSRSIILFKIYIDNMSIDEEKAYNSCTEDFFGGYSLANYLCDEYGIPYREAQKILGKFLSGEKVVTSNSLFTLNSIIEDERGFGPLKEKEFNSFLNPEELLKRKLTSGSTSPESVKEQQRVHIEYLRKYKEFLKDINKSNNYTFVEGGDSDGR